MQSLKLSIHIHLLRYIVWICWLCLVIFCSEVFRYDDYICQYDGIKYLLMMIMPSHIVYCISAIDMNVKFDDFKNGTSYSQIEWLHIITKIETLITTPKILTSPAEWKTPNVFIFKKKLCFIWLLLITIWLKVINTEWIIWQINIDTKNHIVM